MSLGQIDDVDIVANTGTIGGGIVHPKDGEMLPATDGDLSDVGHEIVGDTSGILADLTGSVGAARVKVAEDEDVPLGIGLVQIAQKLLDEELGASVRVCGADLSVLRDGHLLDHPVDGGRGGEYKILAVVLGEQVEEVEGAGEVVVVVADRLLDRLSDGLEPRKVDAGEERELREDGLEVCEVEQVNLTEDDEVRLAGDVADADKRLLGRVVKVVDDHDLVAGLDELEDGMRADVAGTAGDEDDLVAHGGGLGCGVGDWGWGLGVGREGGAVVRCILRSSQESLFDGNGPLLAATK